MISIRLAPCLTFVILAISTPAPIASQTAPPEQTPSPYHITVTPLDRQVGSGQEFAVKLRVTNRSLDPQTFAAMSCGWLANWRARPSQRSAGSHVSLGAGYDCAANILRTITLKPGESYDKQTVMYAWSDRKQHRVKVNFQVGFATSPEGESPVYWSDEAMIEVVK